MSGKNPILQAIDATRMTKSYKMVLLMSLLSGGDLQMEIALDEIAVFFRKVYARHPFILDIRDSANADLCTWSEKRLKSFIIRNPITHILDTPDRVFFFEDEMFGIDPYFFSKLDPELRKVDFSSHIFRRLEYYFGVRYGLHYATSDVRSKGTGCS